MAEDAQMPVVEEVVAPLLQSMKTNVEHLAELLAYCLGSPSKGCNMSRFPFL